MYESHAKCMWIDMSAEKEPSEHDEPFKDVYFAL